MLIPSILSHTESHYLLYTLGVASSWDLDGWLTRLAMLGARTWEERTVISSSLQHILGREGTEIKKVCHLFLNNSGSVSCFPTRWFRAVIQRGCSVVLLPSKTILSVLGKKNRIPLFQNFLHLNGTLPPQGSREEGAGRWHPVGCSILPLIDVCAPLGVWLQFFPWNMNQMRPQANIFPCQTFHFLETVKS